MDFLMRVWEMNLTKLIVTTVSIILLLKYILPFLGPFVIAFIFVLIFNRAFRKIESKTRIPRAFQAGFVLLVIAALIVLAFWGLTVKCMDLVDFFSRNGKKIAGSCCDLFNNCCFAIEKGTGLNVDMWQRSFSEGMERMWADGRENVLPKLMDLSGTYFPMLVAVAAFVTFTIIAILLLAKDFDEIRAAVRQNRLYLKAWEIGRKIGVLMKIYLKAQLIIMSCITVVSIAGLFALGIDGALLWGLIAGFLDVLPFIGTGVVLVPLAIWQIVTGHIYRALGCLLVYGICAFIRQVLEPKLVGEKINIYPVFVLLSVFCGIRLYGVAGIFLGPISLFLIKEIYSGIREESK